MPIQSDDYSGLDATSGGNTGTTTTAEDKSWLDKLKNFLFDAGGNLIQNSPQLIMMSFIAEYMNKQTDKDLGNPYKDALDRVSGTERRYWDRFKGKEQSWEKPLTTGREALAERAYEPTLEPIKEHGLNIPARHDPYATKSFQPQTAPMDVAAERPQRFNPYATQPTPKEFPRAQAPERFNPFITKTPSPQSTPAPPPGTTETPGYRSVPSQYAQNQGVNPELMAKMLQMVTGQGQQGQGQQLNPSVQNPFRQWGGNVLSNTMANRFGPRAMRQGNQSGAVNPLNLPQGFNPLYNNLR